MLSKHLDTSPYLLLLFFTIQSSLAVLDLYALFSAEDTNLGLVAAALLRLVIPTLLAWVAGTLPLAAVLPAKNVACASDVSRTFQQYMPLSVPSSPSDPVE